MNKEYILNHLRNIPDFPKKGIQYKDINYLFTDGGVLREFSTALYELYKSRGITKVVGLETRGRVLASILAEKLGAGLVMCRKPGKMPGQVRQQSYAKEYGIDTIELQVGSITHEDTVLIHDDLLATGGSLLAAYKLVSSFEPEKIMINVAFELTSEGLHGRDMLPKDTELISMLTI